MYTFNNLSYFSISRNVYIYHKMIKFVKIKFYKRREILFLYNFYKILFSNNTDLEFKN